MKLNIFKKGNRELTSAVDTYMVYWKAVHGDWGYPKVVNKCQGFTDKQEAFALRDSINRAYELTGRTFASEVKVKRMVNGLKDTE